MHFFVPNICTCHNSISIVQATRTRLNGRLVSMLFAISLLHTIAFAPALLMAHRLIPYNLIAFYAYHFTSVSVCRGEGGGGEGNGEATRGMEAMEGSAKIEEDVLFY